MTDPTTSVSKSAGPRRCTSNHAATRRGSEAQGRKLEPAGVMTSPPGALRKWKIASRRVVVYPDLYLQANEALVMLGGDGYLERGQGCTPELRDP